MARNLPLITIAISAYNSQDTIAAAVDSALNQNYPNLELLVADDGLLDDTANIVRRKIKNISHAKLIINDKNKGFAGSLNNLIKQAKGEFFAIFDDDDISHPDRISAQYERIINYEKAYNAKWVICHTARNQKFSNDYMRYEPTMGTHIDKIAPHSDQVADRILFGRLNADVVGSCANCSRMARTTLFRAMGGYDSAMKRGEDTDFNIRLARNGGHFVGISTPLVTQTMTMGQEKKLNREKNAEMIILNKHSDYLTEKGWKEFCFKWIDIRYNYLNNSYVSFIKNITTLAAQNPIKLFLKIKWALPAASTRRSFKKWHNQK